MGGFKLGRMTLASLFKKPETILYPAQTRYAPEGLKGHIEWDAETCIFCSLCQKRCPTNSIVVDKEKHTWTIDPFSCIQCGECWRECPKQSLSMLPTYTSPAAAKAVHTYRKEEAIGDEKAVEGV